MFYRFVFSEQQNLATSLVEFYDLWVAASAYGVSSMDGMLQLIQVLPAKWQMWVASIYMDFVNQGLESAEEVDLQRLVDFISVQYYSTESPPPGQFFPPAELVLIEDSDLVPDSDLSEPSEHDQVVPELIVDEPMSVPSIVPDPSYSDHEIASSMDLDDHIVDNEYSPIDLDLYEQPFALDFPSFQDIPPSPYIPDLPPPLPVELEVGPSRRTNVVRNFKYEPEFLTLVGTSQLQSLYQLDAFYYRSFHTRSKFHDLCLWKYSP